MAWTTPMTWTNSVPTAAQFNAQIRDNFNETVPAKATTAGALYVGNGSHSLIERLPQEATEYARESGTMTSYANLPTPGPEVTVTTSNRALIGVTGSMLSNTVGAYTCMSFIVYDGGTATQNTAPDDNYALIIREEMGTSTAANLRASSFRLLSILPAQSNRFQCKYRTNTGTSTWDDRSLLLIPL